MNTRPTNLKLLEFPLETFMQGVYIPEHICDSLINYFEANPSRQEPGVVTHAGSGEKNSVNRIKKSTDISFWPFQNSEDERSLSDYLQYLNLAVQEYEYKYERAKHMAKYVIKSGCNIQKYEPEEGYFEWHTERFDIASQDRCLVWMTFLNDVPNGGTEFMYQNVIVPAKKGLTLIWPSDWTHTHRGQISNTNTKYIITGWFNYLN